MRESLDYVVWFTLTWSAAVVVLVAIAVGIFLVVRKQSGPRGVQTHKTQGPRLEAQGPGGETEP